jgi:ribosomal protein L11 methyltransferase
MNYLEFTFTVEPVAQGSDVLIAALSELSFESFTENEKGFCAYVQEELFDKEELDNCLADYQDTFVFSYSQKLIPQENWNAQWESSFQPIEVGGECLIRAPFHEAKKGFRYDVIIEPKMSFGTGHHNTTQLMIAHLMKLEVKGKSLLDMGCGTGVLAIVASMMGADPVTAIDIDQWSYENTIENLEKNNINNVLVQKGDAQILDGRRFHVILANINKNVLLSDLPVYKAALEKGGNLLLSGFFETDVEQLKEKAGSLGLKFEEMAAANQWTMLHFTN